MKKAMIITVLMIAFAIGMLWADTEERYTLNATVHIQAHLQDVEVYYKCSAGLENGNFVYGGDHYSGHTIYYTQNIWPPAATPVTVHARYSCWFW